MTGWRVGYLMAPRAVLDRLAVLHSHAVTCAPAMIQAACLAALDWDPKEMARAYETRPGLHLPPPGGHGPAPAPAGRGLLRLSLHWQRSSEDFCLRLIQDAGVAAVPGTVFGAEGYVRMSYCCSMEHLQEAMDRLGAIFAAEPMSISIMCTPTSGPLHAIEKGESP